MLIYQAPSERFIDDVRENTISDIMSENYKARLGKDTGDSGICIMAEQSFKSKGSAGTR